MRTDLKEKLLSGELLEFDNDDWCERVQSDDLRGGWVSFVQDKRHSWRNGFQLWFNGQLVHSCKTFQSLEKRLNTLFSNWNLEFR